VVPRAGYRVGVYRDERAGLRVPVLAAAASRERLFDAFLDLLAPLGPTVDVVLGSSHAGDDARLELARADLDLPVLQSHLCDFEGLLLDDGCCGVAAIAAGRPCEVQFDEHKTLVVYARDLAPFAEALRRHGLRRDDGLRLISEGGHLHRSAARHRAAFDRLCRRLGVAEPLCC
jgi:hypothetical protein